MSGIAPGPDPSMEDILASIRRILDTDAATATTPAAETAAPPEDAEEDDELLLDETMLVAAPPVSDLPTPPPEPPAAEAPARHEIPLFPAKGPVMTETPAEPEAAAHVAPPSLLAPAAADVTASSMMSLIRAVGADRGPGVYRGGPTIEDLVRDEIRPLLKDWLDTNLPPLVERLVRIEIERVVNRVAP